MVWVQLFYGVFWISLILIIWFKTDTVIYYCRLFGAFDDFTEEYSIFITETPTAYLPNFLHDKLIKMPYKTLHFVAGLISCPYCVSFWLALITTFALDISLINVAPLYVLSLFVFIQTTKQS